MHYVMFLTIHLIVLSTSCGIHEQSNQVKFAPNKIDAKKPVPYNGHSFDEDVHSVYYAKYRFSKEGYHDVDVAMRVGFNDMAKPIKWEVKDLTVGREHYPVEPIKDIISLYDSQDTANSRWIYLFYGDSSSTNPDTGDQIGSQYVGKYSLPCRIAQLNTANDCPKRKKITDGGACCGGIIYTPASNKSLHFDGEHLTADEGEAFNESWWYRISGMCYDAKLVISGVPEEVEVGKKFRFTVKMKDCYDDLIISGPKAEAKVQLSQRFGGTGSFGDKTGDSGSIDLKVGTGKFKKQITRGVYQKMQAAGTNLTQLRVTATVGGKTYMATSPTIKVIGETTTE